MKRVSEDRLAGHRHTELSVTVDQSAELFRLRAKVRDLLAISTIPQAWVGREAIAIAGGLADMLIDSLNLDVVFVRLCDPTEGDAIEVTRSDSEQPFPDSLRTQIAEISRLSRTEILSTGGGEPYCGIAIPIGMNAESGLVVAASRRADFPSETDQLLLPVAANHAATAFQNACLRRQLDAKVVELGHAHDDLELKVAQRAAENTRLYRDLEERDKKIRRLVDANIVGVSVATLEGQIIDANDALLNMLGYNRDDLISGRLRWTELTPPDWRAVTEQALAQIAAQGTCDVYEKEYLRKDGSRVPVLIAAAAVEETRGEIVGFVLDLTERKRAEQERERLRQLQAHLAHVNRVTTMGELAASLAHEIKQPIAAAKIDAKVCGRALDRFDVQAAREAAARLVKDATRADEIIKRTTALYKKDTLQRERVDINAMIRDIALLFQQEAVASSVSIQTRLVDGILPVMADPVQLQQVFMNLMLNAIDAMKGPGGELRITSQMRDGSELLIGVSDTGIGLPADNPAQIFESFVTTKPDGTGMGLTITRSIVESHGGRLWATANAGPGATFLFTLLTEAEEQRA
jgi:PAS domain S-box-containing protein